MLLGVNLATMEQHVDSQPQRAPTPDWSSWSAHGRCSWVPVMAGTTILNAESECRRPYESKIRLA